MNDLFRINRLQLSLVTTRHAPEDGWCFCYHCAVSELEASGVLERIEPDGYLEIDESQRNRYYDPPSLPPGRYAIVRIDDE